MNTRPIPLRPDASLLQAAERRSFVPACAAIALGVKTSGRRKAVAAKLRSSRARTFDLRGRFEIGS